MLKGKLRALTRTLAIPALGVATIAACSSGDLPSTPTATRSTGARPVVQAISPVTPEWAAMAPESREEWRKTMSRTPLPKEKGCFHVSHPSTQWVEIPCAPAPKNLIFPSGGDGVAHVSDGVVSPLPQVTGRSADLVAPQLVGNGGSNDFASTAPAGAIISAATGSFPSVTGLTSEVDGTANAYSLQLNSNLIQSTVGNTANLCNLAAQPFACNGWEQFIYSSTAIGGIFIQYWLINFGNQCPSGGWIQAGKNCYLNSQTIVPVPIQPITNLANLVLIGMAGSSDRLDLSTGNGEMYSGAWGNELSLESAWTTAEFNVFGDGSSTSAAINNGATIFVQTATSAETSTGTGTVPSGTPTCTRASFTAETNSLTLDAGQGVTNCCAFGGSLPGIVFEETNATPGAPSCRYSGTNSNVADVGNVTMQCTYDANGDPINIYEKVNNVWQPIYTYNPIYSAPGFTGNVGATSVSETPGTQVSLLGCSGPLPPGAFAACGYPVGPGSNGCDSAATSLCFPQTAACQPSQCGETLSDLCGGTVTCPPCCQPITTCQPGMCGNASNNCGGYIPCGNDCPSGEVCVSGLCESSDPCPNGVWFNGKCFRGPGGGGGGGGQPN